MKRLSKIFAVVIALVMLMTIFCMPSSAYIPNSYLEYGVRLEKVTEHGLYIDPDTGEDAADIGVYKAILTYNSNHFMSKLQASFTFDKDLFSVCYNDGTSNYYSYSTDDIGEYTAAKQFVGVVADTNQYDIDGNPGATNLKSKLYGLSHASAGTTFYAAELENTSEAYTNIVSWAGKNTYKNYGVVQAMYKVSVSSSKGLRLGGNGSEDWCEVFLKLNEGKTDADVIGTEIVLAGFDAASVALENMDQYGSLYGMAKTAKQDTCTSITKNGEFVYHYGPQQSFILNPGKSQIRFQKDAAQAYAGKFDVRQFAVISKADFEATFGATVAEQKDAIAEAGFVFVKNTDVANFDITAAKEIITTGNTAGIYTLVNDISYITTNANLVGADNYGFSCIVKNIPDADKGSTMLAFAYIKGTDGIIHFYPTAELTNIKDLYDRNFSTAFPA